MAQPLAECDMFVTYLREDDTMDSLLTRLARITGDPDRLVQKYRLAVVKDFIPHFLHRGMDDGLASRKRVRDSHDPAEDKQQGKKTKVAKADGEVEAKEEETSLAEATGDADADVNAQPDMQLGQDLNGNAEENGGGSDGSDNEQSTSIWSKFQRFHPLYMANGNRSVLLNTDEYPVLGVQRPSGEWGTRRYAATTADNRGSVHDADVIARVGLFFAQGVTPICHWYQDPVIVLVCCRLAFHAKSTLHTHNTRTSIASFVLAVF
jgi:hypothetical protein